MSIQIVVKKGNQFEVIDDAGNKKDAKCQVNYWQELKGRKWKVFSKVENRLDNKVKVCY